MGCHFFYQGALSDPEIEPRAPALANGFFTTESLGNPFPNNELACILKFLLVFSVTCLFAFSLSLHADCNLDLQSGNM